MSQDVYNFSFDDSVSMLDATSTLLLALVAVESLHGSVAVRMKLILIWYCIVSLLICLYI